jgi:hypothetical protein
MVFNNVQLALDIKAQDRLREWFSKRGTDSGLPITCVGLGDSDIDYEMSQDMTRVKILNAPYQVPKIKHHLVYNGVINNVTGNITLFLRHVDSLGKISSLYDYPFSSQFSLNTIPPTLDNGKDFNDITFNTTLSTKEGYIGYLQTLPNGYLDSNNVQVRLEERYTYEITSLPNTWELIIDNFNNSFLLAKPTGYTFLNQTASLKATGKVSGIIKTITFNI